MKQQVADPETKATLTNDDLMHLSRIVTIGELSACFAHEFINPLMLIRGHLHLIEDDLAGDHPLRNSFEVIDRACRRIEDTIKRMLDFSREQTLRSEGCDALSVVSEALRFVRPHLLAQQIDVSLSPDPDLPQIKVDRSQIVQALVNVFQNAADAMNHSDRRVLGVRICKENSDVRIAVSDTGHGIPPEDLPRVFDPFFTTKGEHGTGLGLYITRRVIEEHQGTISAQSDGRGSIFTISLPL